jgi:hypothetical protein
MTPTLDAALRQLGVIPRAEPKPPAHDWRVSVGWKPTYPGEQPPF